MFEAEFARDMHRAEEKGMAMSRTITTKEQKGALADPFGKKLSV